MYSVEECRILQLDWQYLEQVAVADFRLP